jgi:replication initiation protein RepC
VFKARAVDLLAMFPSAAMYVTAPRPGWPDLHAAAARLRHDLGIRAGTWIEALDQLGRDDATIALFVTAERQAHGDIRHSAGAYLTGTLTKARQNALDLPKSLWGFQIAIGEMPGASLAECQHSSGQPTDC